VTPKSQETYHSRGMSQIVSSGLDHDGEDGEGKPLSTVFCTYSSLRSWDLRHVVVKRNRYQAHDQTRGERTSGQKMADNYMP